MALHPYKLTATRENPRFDAERRYILVESKMAKRKLEQARGQWWPFFTYTPLGIYRRSDWRRYISELDSYSRKLDHHEKEIEEGLIPLHVHVTNTQETTDTDIKIQLLVGDGAIHAKKKPPKRPERMDGAPDNTDRVHFRLPVPGGFMRRHIQISAHGINVEYSKLEPNHSALLVNQLLYFKCSEKTRLAFTVQSAQMGAEQRGWVDIED